MLRLDKTIHLLHGKLSTYRRYTYLFNFIYHFILKSFNVNWALCH